MYRIIAGPFDGYIAYNDQDELVFVQAPLINCANGCAEADRDVLSFDIDEAANFPPLEFDLADDSEVVSLEPSQIADADGRVGKSGDAGRIRLSRLERYGLEEEFRHGNVITAYGVLGLSTPTQFIPFDSPNDFRWSDVANDAEIDSETPDTVPAPFADADGIFGVDGQMGRVRLSRLGQYNVDDEHRHGPVHRRDDAMYRINTETGPVYLHSANDFRWD